MPYLSSRTILSDKGGYTVIEGERCTANRGDLILTPNGTWHDHGNNSDEPVVWIDTLDWPLYALGALGHPFTVITPPELITHAQRWSTLFADSAS